MEPAVLIGFGLLGLGVAASLDRRVPGGALSLAGVGTIWWRSGFVSPARRTVLLLAGLGLLALAGWLFERVIATRIRRASTVSATLAGLVGLVALLFLGTLGLIAGTLTTVFVLEYLRRRTMTGSFLAALTVVVGTVASRLVQLLLTGLMLVVVMDSVLI